MRKYGIAAVMSMLFFGSSPSHATPSLVLLSGAPGWGKTTLSRSLAAKFHLVRIDLDSIAEAFSPSVRDDHYKMEIEPKVVQALFNIAQYNLEAGNSVIADGVWSHLFRANPNYLKLVQAFSEHSSCKLLLIEGKLNTDLLLGRIRARGALRDAPKLENPQEFFEKDHVGLENLLPHVVLDGSGSEAEVFDRASRIVSEHFGL